VKFAFIGELAAEKLFTVAYMCALLGVSRSGFYRWRRRRPSVRENSNIELSALIGHIFAEHRGRYGVRRVHAELLRRGLRVGYNRVQRLMRSLGLVSVHPRPWRKTTIRAGRADLPDLVGRRFSAAAPNLVWYGDITYVKTWDGWAYVASVIDAYSRKVVGWAVADHMRTDLVVHALDMALRTRRPDEGVIFHADRGSQYTSAAFVEFCRRRGVRNSVGRTGVCWDNAGSESFWATLKKELIHLHPWAGLKQLRTAVFTYIESYYNRQRLHSTIGYRTPEECETEFDNRQHALIA
jgi:transposase InsO family protein